jgi:heme-degrading monooxygenase HmoA
MVKHIVFFKLNDNSQENKEKVKNKLLSMDGEIDILRGIEVGINFAQEERAYDIALITEFDSKEDLKAYASHPFHQKIISYMKSSAKSSKVVDF